MDAIRRLFEPGAVISCARSLKVVVLKMTTGRLRWVIAPSTITCLGLRRCISRKKEYKSETESRHRIRSKSPGLKVLRPANILALTNRYDSDLTPYLANVSMALSVGFRRLSSATTWVAPASSAARLQTPPPL